MRLRDLDARLLKRCSDGSGSDTVRTIAEADGILFQCPKCAQGKEVIDEDGRRFVRGAHAVICWFVGHVPDDVDPKPGRWTPTGEGIDDITFVPGTPPQAVSVLLTNPNGCGWHGHIVGGDASLS